MTGEDLLELLIKIVLIEVFIIMQIGLIGVILEVIGVM